ncbi:MAG: hypothetical protein VXW22_12055, partial [Pseudomonadota bacterium]|nr:hypothetical protein [Pseudomonadota bacterium]
AQSVQEEVDRARADLAVAKEELEQLRAEGEGSDDSAGDAGDDEAAAASEARRAELCRVQSELTECRAALRSRKEQREQQREELEKRASDKKAAANGGFNKCV